MIVLKKIPMMGIITAFMVLFLDQLTKWVAIASLKEVGSVNVLPIFNFTLVYNKGVSFGMFNGGSIYEILFIFALTCAILIFVFIWLFKVEDIYKAICLGLVIGGAIGNLIDRFVYPGVVDFLDFYIGKHHFPVFNLADSCIFCAVVLLLSENFIKKRFCK